ncbi:farnesyl-diphosphate synthase [Dentipellis sp. KUC8613]|nr:farnesyl-diphosphate synthase [Dentipellis sp. KUC8613]
MAPVALSPAPTPALALQPNGHPAKAKLAQSSRQRFLDTWPIIRGELLDAFAAQGLPANALEWHKNSLDYNVPGGKLNRGLSVVDSVELFKGRRLTDAEHLEASVLGWGVEFLQAYFLVTDDLMDGSHTRRGQPCWYRVPRVGLIAVNDAGMLRSCIFILVRKHFRHTPFYADLLELFDEMAYKTEIGQLVDLITAPEGDVDLDRFSLSHYETIIKFKTAYYSFYLPVALAMTLCRIPHTSDTGADPYDTALSILLPLGAYFQIQDDVLDVTAPPAVLGKVGTDIVDGKCSWCINTALAHCTPAQRAVLADNYGRKDAACEARVKDVFAAVGIEARYAAYERDVYARLKSMIAAVPEVRGEDAVFRGEALSVFLEKIHGRSN